MSLQEFDVILDKFSGYQFGEFAFNSINEPFADKTILDKLKLFMEHGCVADKVFFSSNWLLPDRNKLRTFFELMKAAIESENIGVFSLNATISGVDAETYDVLQGGRDLEGANFKYKKLNMEKAVANILQLISWCQSEIGESVKYSINLKAYGDGLTDDAYATFWLRLFESRAIDESFIKSQISIRLNHAFTTFARDLSADYKTDSQRSCSMLWLKERLVIGPDSNIGLCCHEGGRKFDLGNLQNSSLVEIVRGKAYQDNLAILFGPENPPDDHPCGNCEFFISN